MTLRGAGWCAVTVWVMLLSGCLGNYRLVSRGMSPAATGWHQYVTPRLAEGAVEKAVVEVARTRQLAGVSDVEVVYIADDAAKRVQCVDVVSKGSDDNPFAARKVVRYRVLDGKIAAMSDATEEFFVDAELERAVLGAAAKASSPDPVILYQDGNRTFSIAGSPISRCMARVMIFEGDAVGTPIASKRVAICSL